MVLNTGIGVRGGGLMDCCFYRWWLRGACSPILVVKAVDLAFHPVNDRLTLILLGGIRQPELPPTGWMCFCLLVLLEGYGANRNNDSSA